MYHLLMEARKGKMPSQRLLTCRIGADRPARNARQEGHQDHRLAKHRRCVAGEYRRESLPNMSAAANVGQTLTTRTIRAWSGGQRRVIADECRRRLPELQVADL
jgi:hypothetical protein